jgi:hypothetical protein
MRYLSIICLLFFPFAPAVDAGEANVVAAEVNQTQEQTYRFTVSVLHADTGWEHYADRWEVIGQNGDILDTRVLAHPHVNEQPFTRSLSGVNIPAGVHQVTIRAHDSIHEFGGTSMNINLD